MNIYEKLVEIKKDIKGFNKDTKSFGYEYVTKKGEKKLDFIVTMKMNYTWVNAEDPNDKIVVPWVCMGQQTDDISKAVGTAMTYNERYFLLKFLGLPTDEDDADAKGVSIKPNMTPVSGLSEAQLKRLLAIGNKSGFNKDTIVKTVKKLYGCELKDMTREQYNEVCNRLESKGGK